MGEEALPFIGSDVLARGALSRYELRTQYAAILPDIYLVKRVQPSLQQRIIATWLWSHREGVVAGLAASSLHGAKWVDDDVPVELIWTNARAPRGVVTRDDLLLSGEVQSLHVALTTPIRTAFDIGRRGRVSTAVARLDALAHATGFKADDVLELAGQHRRARGLRQLERVLDLVDAGAQSPKETWLRLLLIDAGFPRPQTQIPVYDDDGYPFAFLDMGWDDVMVAVEYDGEQHRTDRQQYVRDIRRSERIAERTWRVVKVVKEDLPANIIRRVGDAWGTRAKR